MGIEAISHEAISIYIYIHSTYILYLYIYQAMYRMEKSGLQNTSPTSHRSNHWRTSGPLSPRRWGFLASPWILLEDDPTSKMCFLFSRSSRQSSWNPPLFHFSPKCIKNALLANAGSEALSFAYFIISPTQHKHCTIKGNQSGNPSFLPYNLHQVWSHQNGWWHLIWAPAEPSRPGPGPVSDHLGVEFSSSCHMTINKNESKRKCWLVVSYYI